MENRRKKLLFMGILLSGCIFTSIMHNFSDSADNDKFSIKTETEKHQVYKKIKYIKVYVSGAVSLPGIYELPLDSRAEDAVAAAGGLIESADVNRVNLARKLKDGYQVNVPTIKKRILSGKESKTNSEKQLSTADEQQVQHQQKVKINSADVQELEQLPGIGPAMAQRIIYEREKKRFYDLDDLLRVKGIGKAKLRKIKDLVEID